MLVDQELLTEIAEYLTPPPRYILVMRNRSGNNDYAKDMWVPRTDLEPTYTATVVSPGEHPHKIGDQLCVKEHCGSDLTLTIDGEEIWLTFLIYDEEVLGEEDQ